MTAVEDVPAVVVGVDGSEPARQAVLWGAREAHRRGAPLRLVGVLDWAAYQPLAALGDLDEQQRERLRAHVGQWLEDAAEQAGTVAPDVVIGREIRVGSVPNALLVEADTAQVLVVGNRGRGGFSELVLGSTTMAVSTLAPCPVVVIRDADEHDGPVVVGVDGSPGAAQALEYAVDAAAAHGAPLRVVRAWVHDSADAWVMDMVAWDRVEDEVGAELEKLVQPWRDRRPEVALEAEAVRGHPVPTLVRASEGARLLVVGSRGRGGLSGLLLGSVSRSVLHHARCPVAVVRTGGATG